MIYVFWLQISPNNLGVRACVRRTFIRVKAFGVWLFPFRSSPCLGSQPRAPFNSEPVPSLPVSRFRLPKCWTDDGVTLLLGPSCTDTDQASLYVSSISLSMSLNGACNDQYSATTLLDPHWWLLKSKLRLTGASRSLTQRHTNHEWFRRLACPPVRLPERPSARVPSNATRQPRAHGHLASRTPR